MQSTQHRRAVKRLTISYQIWFDSTHGLSSVVTGTVGFVLRSGKNFSIALCKRNGKELLFLKQERSGKNFSIALCKGNGKELLFLKQECSGNNFSIALCKINRKERLFLKLECSDVLFTLFLVKLRSFVVR